MRNKMLVVIGILLFALGQIGVNFLIYKHKHKKNIDIPKVQLRDVWENKKDKKKSFAIMLEQDDGSYKETTSNSFEQLGYVYNSEKSKCVDEFGNVLENILNYDKNTKMMGVKTSKTAFCHVYFDKLKNLYEACGINTMTSCESSGKLNSVESLWQSGLEGDGYRYTGTNPNNYICFGTTKKATCTGNTDAYMYRIIGVFADTNGNQHMKLIKKEALNTAYKWNDSNSDVDWGSSTLKSNLNGDIYLNNTTYMPSGWSDRIASWTWNTVNTKTWESSGPNYYNGVNTKQMYLHEMDKSGAPSGGVHGTLPNTKIGLMYVIDYALSLGEEAKALTTGTYTNREKLKTGWMYLWNSNNDSSAPNTSYEWTISRYGRYSNGDYCAMFAYSDGNVNSIRVYNTYSARPVFYLESSQVIKSGSGTISDPYILSD